MFNKILIVIALILFAGFFLYALNYGLTLSEINECDKWQREMSLYPDYYLTANQQAQCEYLGFDVEGWVKYQKGIEAPAELKFELKI